MNNAFQDFVVPPLVLTVICLVVTVALVFTFNLTEPIIEQQAIEAANQARIAVLPGAAGFEEVVVEEMPEGGVDCYKATDDSGYVITGSARGYGGTMKVMAGIKNDGTLAGVQVLEQNETQGLGSKVTEPAFTDQFVGKDVNMSGIETISGATISSRAFITALTNAYKVYGIVAGVDMGTGGEPARDPLTLAQVQEIFPSASEYVRLDTELESYKVGEEGFIVVTMEPGFADDMVAAVGFNTDGTIAGIVFTQINETPEYGMKLNTTDYLSKYVGLSDITGVEKVAGATVSSDAFQKLVQKTIDAFPEVKEAQEPVSLLQLQSMMEAYGTYEAVGIQDAKYALKGDGVTGVVMTTEGFGGPYEVIVIVNDDGTVAQVALGKNEETEGYGSKVGEQAHTSLFVGATENTVDNVEIVSGATVTSYSFKSAVKHALQVVKGA